MIFETEQDLKRQHSAITTFVNTFGGSFKKLDPNDVDYKVFDKEGNLIAYVEIRTRIRTIHNAYPLPIPARKVLKLSDKRLNPVIIWACEDGIIYSRIEKLKGEIKWGGNAPFDIPELIIFYEKQKSLKYVRFV